MEVEIVIPDKVDYIINKLMEHNFEAFAVGGCVRDSILGRKPQDWDVTTSARPNEIKEVFKRTVDTGIEHGTVTVLLDKEGFEVTTYRIDGEYADNRHPKKVEFTDNLKMDLERRDFTINAMAYNKIIGLVDVFGGYEDIQKKIIRCVGSPSERFDEDGLRILRAIRFSAQLGFDIDDETRISICDKAELLNHISSERIREEINKLLLSEHPDMMIEASNTGITRIILPEFDCMLATEQNNSHHVYNVGMHSIKAVEAINQLFLQQFRTLSNEVFSLEDMNHLKSYFKEDLFSHKTRLILCWTMLLHDVAKSIMKVTDEYGIDHFYGHPEEGSSMAKDILRRLKFDNYTFHTVKQLIKYHDSEYRLTPSGIRKAINRIGEDNIILLFFVKYADIMAQNRKRHIEKLEYLQKALKIYLEVMGKQECVSLRTMEVNGRDLISVGFEPGKQIGEILDYLLKTVIEDPEFNKKEILLSLACQHFKK